jgi:hypothetical protein
MSDGMSDANAVDSIAQRVESASFLMSGGDDPGQAPGFDGYCWWR